MSDRGPHPAARVLVAGLSERPSPFLLRLFDGLRDAGHRVEEVRSLPPGARRTMATLLAQRTHLVPAGEADDVLRARLMVARWRPDVVYLPWNSTAVPHRGLLASDRASVISCRGSQVAIGLHDPDRADQRELVLDTLRAATLVHCVSADMGHRVVELGVEADRVRVVRPAVDLDRFRPPQEERGPSPRFRIASLGALSWKKGNEDLLLAVAALRDRGVDVELDLIGSGPERERVVFTRDDLGLTDRVELPGDLSPDEVAERLAAADAFALASLSEGISNAVLEAMACARPVVTTDVGGQDEAITDGVDGLLVAPRDPTGLADALERLARDPALRRSLGASARERVERHHDLRDQVADFSALLDEAVHRTSSGSAG